MDFVNDPDVKLLVLIILGAGLAAALWYFWDDIRPPTDQPIIIQTAPIDQEQRGPREPMHPISPPGSSGPIDAELVPLPSLDESDSYFLLALVDIFGADIERMLVNEALVDKFVATVDNLTRSHVSEKIQPVSRLSGTFVVDATGNDGQLYLSTDNYQRYDLLVNLLSRAELEVVAEMYRRFYPLFQESYVRLGYPNGYFNDRVVEVIDHLLATPEPAEPVQLVRPHVLYEFANPELEALSSGQKLLIRTGSDHAATIKSALIDLRVLVTRQ